MTVSVLDAGLAAEVYAATAQEPQLALITAEFPGQVEVRYYSAGDVLRSTVTHAAWVLSATDPRYVELGARVSETLGTPGAASYAIVAVPGGADVLRCDVMLAGPVAANYGTNLGTGSGADGLRVYANSTLPVSDEPFNALIGIWGQSNAIGRADSNDITAAPLSSDPELATFNTTIFDRVWIWSGANFGKLQMGVNNDALAGNFGPEFGLAVRWMRSTTAGDLYLIKRAGSGASITEFEPGVGTRYIQGELEHSQADDWLSVRSIVVPSRSMVWIQGESDSGQTESWYRTRLDALVAAWATDGVRGASDPVVIAQMHPTTDGYGAGVFAAKTAFVAANSSYAIERLMPPYMKSDNLHQNGRGQVQMGYDYAASIFGFAQVNV